MRVILKYLLLLYRKIAVAWISGSCRFYPSCSYYAEEAIDKYGPLNGLFLALKRLIRCNQFFPGGFDPVPEKTFHPPSKMFHVEHFLRRTSVKHS